MKRLLEVFLVLALMGLSGAAIAEENGAAPEPQEEPASLPVEAVSKPVQMVRTLQLMQDQIALGSIEAHMGQRGLLTILDSRFMDLETDLWLDTRNVRAAVAFVLSGGKPQILRKLLEMSNPPLPLEHRAFVEGTLAYVEGREEEAKNRLLSTDVRSLPPMLGAQLALVQSALLVRTDPKRSSELLDFVRLQAPGTLLEEGALRRQVFVASQTGDMKKFLSLSSDYLRRYRHSVYAGNFRQRLAAALTRIDFGKDRALFDGVAEILTDLEPDARRDLYLVAARASIDQGFTQSARMLAAKARELSQGDSVSATRANLYRAAARIVLPDELDSALAELRAIDRSLLPESDAALLQSAVTMAEHIRQLPGVHVAENPNPPPSPGKAEAVPVQAAGAQQAPEQLQALSKARDALSRIDKIIKSPASAVP